MLIRRRNRNTGKLWDRHVIGIVSEKWLTDSIFDEGHNLNAAREAASFSATADSLAETVQNMVKVATPGGQTENSSLVKEIVEIVLKDCEASATSVETAGRNIDAGL